MPKPRQPRHTRASRTRKARRKAASKRLESRPNARGVYPDGSKLITDQNGHVVGTVEAHATFTVKMQKRPTARKRR